MDVEDPVRKRPDEISRQQAHVAGQTDPLDVGATQPLDHPAVVLLASGRVLMRNACRLETKLRSLRQSRSIGSIAQDQRDLGWVDEDGYLYIADRRVDMIITGGANVFPAEIEAALSEHPGVADVVVVGLPDEEWGRRLHAIIEPHDSSAVPTDEELRAHCKERLAPYKSPKSFEFVAKMPRSAAGKINRSALTAERAPSE